MRISLLHSLLQPVMRATADRYLAGEVRDQLRLRSLASHELWSYSFEKAVSFANLMSTESAGFREKLRQDRIAMPVSAATWHRLPILTKDDFRRDDNSCYGELVQREKVIWMFTSGSTGKPFKFPISKASRTAEIAANELNLLAVGWKPAMRQAVVKVESKPVRGVRGIYHMLAGSRSIWFPASEFLALPAPVIVERIRRERIAYLRGYARSIYLFAQKIIRQGISCPIPLVTTLGEALSPEEATIIEHAFNAKVYRDYGGSEAMHIGFECREQRGYHIDMARYFVEIMREGKVVKEGEEGDIVVTAFCNSAMPLVRYRIGDIGRAESNGPCPCGNGFPLLAEVLGRTAEEVVTSNGNVINNHVILAVFKHSNDHIAEFKVIQRERDRFEVLWVALHDRAIDHVPVLQQKLVNRLGAHVTVDWHEVAEIPPEKSGKRRILVPLQA